MKNTHDFTQDIIYYISDNSGFKILAISKIYRVLQELNGFTSCIYKYKTIAGGLTPDGRLRMEKLAALATAGRIDLSKLVTHKFNGMEHLEEALLLMKDKPKDIIKPVVIF